MEAHPYWQRQTPEKPLFPDIEWNKPEQKLRAGKLGIIGGNKQGFIAVAESYSTSLKVGVGSAKVLLPDVLKKSVPPAMVDVTFGPSNTSGGLSNDAKAEMTATGEWASGVLLIGDCGRNSETAVLYENFILDYQGQLTVTRDAVDLLKNSSQNLLVRENTLLIMSFSQLQKVFQTVYYPKMMTFSMQLSNLVETLHKFTITYPLITIVTLHQDHIIICHDGQIITQQWSNQMSLWRGEIATYAASYWLWSPTKPLEAIATSILSATKA